LLAQRFEVGGFTVEECSLFCHLSPKKTFCFEQSFDINKKMKCVSVPSL